MKHYSHKLAVIHKIIHNLWIIFWGPYYNNKIYSFWQFVITKKIVVFKYFYLNITTKIKEFLNFKINLKKIFLLTPALLVSIIIIAIFIAKRKAK